MCVFFVLYIQYFPYCLFVSNSQVIGCEDPLRNDLYCVGWGLNSTKPMYVCEEVYCGAQGRCRGLKVAPLCSWKGTSYLLLQTLAVGCTV